MPTDDDIDRSHRKATIRLSLFEKQMKAYRRGKQGPPEIDVGFHPGLQRMMTAEWLEGMHAWSNTSIPELTQKLADGEVEFQVDRIGGVKTVLELNGKTTRVELYMPDKTNARSWRIVMEPLAYSPNAGW